MSKQQEIIEALRTVAGNADTLFQWIKTDLERGNEHSARQHLDFIDALLSEDTPKNKEKK